LKYFRHLFNSAAEALVAIFFDGRHADKAIEHYFKTHKKWGKRDRQFFAETVYGCVRWWNLYEELANSGDQQRDSRDPLEIAHRCMAVHLILNNQPLPEWYESYFTEESILKKQAEVTSGHLKYAVPEWLYVRGAEELGEERWKKVLQALNKPASVVLRANTLKNPATELIARLRKEEILAEVIDKEKYPSALVLSERGNVFKTKVFQDGGFELQDASSQLVGQLLNPQPGERVVDACAGAGGKSLHLASLMKNKGKILSLDVVAWKLEELKKRAKRAGVSIIEPRHIDSTKVIKRLKDTADALLLDVPCSGLGVLRRNPDSKWKLSLDTLNELHETQKSILQSYSGMVKSGGRMVYATCSVLPSENSLQVENFLKSNAEWKLISENKIFPDESGFDGFYMALLTKK
jgi:16S rRNA (cytosine967-C5)-methyltransferase